MRRSPALVALAASLVLAVAGCGSSDDGAEATTTTTSTTEAPPLTGTTQPPTLAQQKAVISFAPVLASGPCAIPPAPTDGPTPSDTTVPAPGTTGTPDREGALCYDLGPTAADGNDLTDATVVADEVNGASGIEVTVAPASVDALNALFDACFAGAPTCPAYEGGVGAVAIVYEGAVVSAPSVQAAGLASSPLRITGNFTEAEATELAELLDRTS